MFVYKHTERIEYSKNAAYFLRKIRKKVKFSGYVLYELKYTARFSNPD